jgi:hypothetical protein
VYYGFTLPYTQSIRYRYGTVLSVRCLFMSVRILDLKPPVFHFFNDRFLVSLSHTRLNIV